jgi:hypothetical protein
VPQALGHFICGNISHRCKREVAGHQLVRECNRRRNAAYPVAVYEKTDYLYAAKELQRENIEYL